MKNKIIIIILVGLGLVGCDKTCHTTVQDYVTIQNNTFTDLTLSICKGTSGESLLRLNATTSGLVSLGSREEAPTKSNGMSTCSSKTIQNYNTPITLAPMSVGIVKLCYRQMDNTYVVTAVYQACPINYAEVASNGPCIKQ